MDLNSLTKKQLEAVVSDKSIIRVIAGAGSGKTRILTYRIAYLINELKVDPKKILAITFTNKAAKEMSLRIDNLLGSDIQTNISTIHSFCAKFLREEISVLGYPKNYIIIDTEDQKLAMKKIVKNYDSLFANKVVNAMLKIVSTHLKEKSDNIDFDAYYYEYRLDELKITHNDLKKIYDQYLKYLEDNKYLDFDDLILKTLKILKEYKEIRTKWSNRFEHILFDEFQDIDNNQYEIIKCLLNERNNLFVVGDPDQTIYSFRGAKVDIIVNFDKDFPKAKTFIVNENFRCAKNILDVANKLIANNTNRVEKDLFTSLDYELAVHYNQYKDYNEEAEAIVSNIKNNPCEDVAILYRSNYLSNVLETKLRNERIPFHIYGSLPFYQRKEIKDLIAYLRLIVNGDEISFERVINVPSRKIGNKSLDRLEMFASENKLSLLEACKQIDNYRFNDFYNIIKELRSTSLDKLFDRLIELISYKEHLERLENYNDKLDNIMELRRELLNHFEIYGDDLESYLSEISLYIDNQNSDEKKARVKLMTVHAAKGLEFEHVYIYALNEGIFPISRIYDAKEDFKNLMEEERRLAYVAITRAKKKLFISSNKGKNYSASKNIENDGIFKPLNYTESSFVGEIKNLIDDFNELPENHIDRYHNALNSNHNKLDPSLAAYKPKMVKKKPKLNKVMIKKGSIITHDSFGDGIVIDIDDKILTISFLQKQHGMKKFTTDNPLIKVKQ